MIAELSGNHNGSLERALALIDAAKSAGADAVKFQTYTPQTMTIRCDRPDFLITGGLWDGRTLYDLYEWAHTPWEWHEAMFQRARSLGLLAFSAPFDVTSVDFLESIGNPIYKIASFELVDLELISKASNTGKPLIISTGMGSLKEIGEAVAAAQSGGAESVTLLHCVSGYPTPLAESRVATLVELRKLFGCPVGLSDHSTGQAAAQAATALGAVMIEKHFTLNRADGGPDAAFSLEPQEFKHLADSCRDIWAAVGRVDFSLAPSEQASQVFRRSLFAVKNIAQGEALTRENVRAIRPGTGLAPKHLAEILGKRASGDIELGTPLSWSLII